MSSQIYAKEYEDYLISGNEDSINTLPNGSIEKDYFLIIKKLLKEDLTPELDKKIFSFLERIPKEKSYRLKALCIFKKIKQNPEKKDEIIQEIKSLFNIGEVTHYSKPMKYIKKTGIKIKTNDERSLPHELKLENYITIDKFIEGIYTGKIIPNDNEINKIFNNTFDYDIKYNLDFNKIPKDTLLQIFLNYPNFTRISISILSSFKYAKLEYFKDVLNSLIDLIKADKEKKKNFDDFFLDKSKYLLTEQIEYILIFNSLFHLEKLVVELIERKYPYQPKDKKERIKILKEIKTILNKYNYTKDKMTCNVLLSILELNSEMNIYEFDTFIEYIEMPLYDLSDIYNISKELKEKIKSNDYQNVLDVQVIYMDKIKEKKLIEKYLKYFFLNDKIDCQKLNKYFNEDFIKIFYSKMKFYSGDEKPLKDKILSLNEINDLMKEIQLTICNYNKEKFEINEDIELILEIKNIQILYVNIYEINTENYYYLNGTEFNQNISLDGIVPTFEDKFNFNEKPQLLLTKKISLSKIPKKRGLYVVEFIGNGHVSRAIIQKGNFKCIHKNTINVLSPFNIFIFFISKKIKY